jgi:hypothetical protein
MISMLNLKGLIFICHFCYSFYIVLFQHYLKYLRGVKFKSTMNTAESTGSIKHPTEGSVAQQAGEGTIDIVAPTTTRKIKNPKSTRGEWRAETNIKAICGQGGRNW